VPFQWGQGACGPLRRPGAAPLAGSGAEPQRVQGSALAGSGAEPQDLDLGARGTESQRSDSPVYPEHVPKEDRPRALTRAVERYRQGPGLPRGALTESVFAAKRQTASPGEAERLRPGRVC